MREEPSSTGPSGPGDTRERRRALPDAVRRRRELLGYTQKDLADTASVSISTVEQLERIASGRGVSPRVASSIAEALETTSSALFASPASSWLAQGAPTVAEAAEEAGVTKPVVYSALETGELTARPPPSLPDLATVPATLSPRGVADLAGTSREAISRAIRENRLPATRAPDGPWRIRSSDALAHAASSQPTRVDPRSLQAWIARRAERRVTRSPVELVCAKGGCGKTFTRHPSKAGQSARSYCSPECYHSDPARYSMRAELLTKAGGCGSPTCLDPDCAVAPGRCHRDGCDNVAAIATHTSSPIRWVKDKPITYCSPSCWAQARNTPDPARVRDLDAAGYRYGLDEAARKALRAPSVLARWLDKLELGEHAFGDGRRGDPRRISDADIEAVRAEIAKYDHLRFKDPSNTIGWIEGWYFATFGCKMPPGLYGRYNAAAAKRKETSLRQPAWKPATEEERQRLLTLTTEGSDQRAARILTAELRLDPPLTRHQVRHLRKAAAAAGRKLGGLWQPAWKPATEEERQRLLTLTTEGSDQRAARILTAELHLDPPLTRHQVRHLRNAAAASQ